MSEHRRGAGGRVREHAASKKAPARTKMPVQDAGPLEVTPDGVILTTQTISRLQRTGGNSVVSRLIAMKAAVGPTIWRVAIQRFKGNIPELAKTKTPTEMATYLKADEGATFKQIFEVLVEQYAVTLAILKPLVDAAAQSERDTVWGDAALMTKTEGKLGRQPYLDLLTALRMFQSGTTAEDSSTHTKASKADEYIRDKLATYVGEAVKAGKQIEGKVGVVSGADWDRAGEAHYGKAVWSGGKKDDINGFVDAQGRVWIEANSGNAGTMIHEGIHKYSQDAVLNASQPLNEGVTELYTRKVCAALTTPISRGNYASNYEVAKKLADLVGEDVVAKAYFDGKMDDLKTAFIGKGKTADQWTQFLSKTSKGEWSAAEGILAAAATPAPATPPATGGPTK